MMNVKEKLLYCLALVIFLALGVGVGFYTTKARGTIRLDEKNLNYAIEYDARNREDNTVPASTMVVDVEVIYEDHYLGCNEDITTTKTVYGTTIDSVKEQERKEQEEKGLLYAIKAESNNKIIYTRNVKENCPNHFQVKLNEEGIITIYTIKGEDKKEVYMTLPDINASNLRDEMKIKVEKGAYINSREELNKFIEDLET